MLAQPRASPTVSSSATASGCDHGSSASTVARARRTRRSTMAHAAVVLVGEPRRVVADVRAVVQDVGQLARLGDVARHQREAELGDQLLVGGVRVADHLPAELDQRPSSSVTCSTRPPTRLRASSTSTSAPPAARSRAADRPARPAPSDDDVVRHCRSPRFRSAGRGCARACQPMRTRSPSTQRSSVRAPVQVLLEHGELDAGRDLEQVRRGGAAVDGGLEDRRRSAPSPGVRSESQIFSGRTAMDTSSPTAQPSSGPVGSGHPAGQGDAGARSRFPSSGWRCR